MPTDCPRICHLTTVHRSDDARIFLKQCRSAAAAGLDTYFVAANGESREEDGVTVVGIQTNSNARVYRMWRSVNAVCDAAIKIKASIYHLHDPELLRVARKLQRTGAKVIYDVHEDTPKQILGKHWISPPLRASVAACFAAFEERIAKQLDYIVTATPTIRDRFLTINPNTIDINNFPLLGELHTANGWQRKRREVSYVGGIAPIRGLSQVIAAMGKTDGIRLNLLGNISPAEYRDELMALDGWKSVSEQGFVSRRVAREFMARSMAGLVTFLPLPNHIDSQPTKMFEYMSAGLPVIASDFELWRAIVEPINCGICVNPEDPDAIATAITALIDNPKRAEKLGQNGRKAIEERYNWALEAEKLVSLYRELVSNL